MSVSGTSRWVMAALAGLLFGALPGRAQSPPAKDDPAGQRRVVRDGVAIDFTIDRVGEPGALLEGDLAEVRFRMTDVASGRPVPGLKPAAWMDMAGVVGGKPGQERECKDRVALYLQGSVGIRPMIDLNSYYLVLLNRDASISVIDPVVSMTGNTSLLASVVLKRPGADWVRTRDGRRLYVSMPRAGEVAIIDSEAFRLLDSVASGPEPMRLALQADGRYLWVANDAKEAAQSGVTVIDTGTMKPVGRVVTGRGHHEIAFSGDGRLAFVSNREEGTVSAIDIATLRKVKDLKTGPLPLSVAWSPLSQSIYVADGKAGTVAVIDPSRLEVVTRIPVKPGLGPMRFSQDGRWGFVANPAERSVFVVDAAENRLAHTIPVDGKPYQVALTRAFAYVRLLDSEQVKMVNLQSLGPGKKPIVQTFGAGTGAPMTAGELSLADAISQASTDAAIFVLNPADSTTYFYMEGMNAPMGSYGGYGHSVTAATVVDRSLKEVEPGIYAGKVKIPVAGRYDVAFLLDNPRVLHCFSADALSNPALKKGLGEVAVEFVDFPAKAAAGSMVPIRVRLTDPSTREPRDGLADVRVLYHVVPGGPKSEAEAVARGGGVYEAAARVDRPGAWYFFVSVPSLKVKPSAVPYRGLVVEAQKEKSP
jgi:DNA-binding beta-propeller fold protein YncE